MDLKLDQLLFVENVLNHQLTARREVNVPVTHEVLPIGVLRVLF